MPIKMKQILATLILVFTSFQSQATTVHYDVSNVSGNLWQYDYTIINDTLTTSIEEVTIYFDQTIFTTLSSPLAPTNWNAIVIPAPTILDDVGFYDALANPGPGIGVGESLSGFSLQVVYSGAGTPGAQSFDIFEPGSYDTPRGSGTASLSPIPLPAAAWLFGSGLIALVTFTRRRNKA